MYETIYQFITNTQVVITEWLRYREQADVIDALFRLSSRMSKSVRDTTEEMGNSKLRIALSSIYAADEVIL